MSVLVIGTFKADREKFLQILTDRGAELEQIAARGRAAGAIHHRFGVGADGTVVIVDEWDSAEHFESFFRDPSIGELMTASDAAGPPSFTIVEAVDTVDAF